MNSRLYGRAISSVTFHAPLNQNGIGGGRVLVRTMAEPVTAGKIVRETVHAIDADMPVENVRSLEEIRDGYLATPRLTAVLLSIFAALAMLVTLAGITGVIATSVSQRTTEFGIRIALGARRDAVIAMVIREVLRQAAIGTLVGVPAAFVALTLIRSALYGVSPADLQHSAIATVVLVGCILAAGYLPARRASRIEPMEALRHE